MKRENLNGNNSLEPPMRVTHPFYQIIKDATFNFYLWGQYTDDVEITEFYKDMNKVFRKYDDRFILSSRTGE